MGSHLHVLTVFVHYLWSSQAGAVVKDQELCIFLQGYRIHLIHRKCKHAWVNKHYLRDITWNPKIDKGKGLMQMWM